MTTVMVLVFHKDAAWESSDNFEQQCAEHLRLYAHFLEKKCLEMRGKVEEVEKAGVDWTNGHKARLEHEVHKLEEMDRNLWRLAQTDDPIQFLKVIPLFHFLFFYFSCLV